VKAVLAQLAPRSGELAANLARALNVIADASARLVVFPELFLSGYDLAQVRDCAVEADGPELGRLRAAAAEAGVAVAVGFSERADDTIFNSLALVEEGGEIVAVYRKLQLFGDERDVFEPGDALVVARLAGRMVGPLICFDMEFPELARALALAGADLLLTASANMAPFGSDHRIACQARALENRLSHLYCNRCGTEAGVHFVGESRAITPDGEIAAEAGANEALLRVPVMASEVSDERVDYLKHLRTDIRVNGPTLVAGGSR
jgi:predicted amidohydrolase